MDIRSEVIAAVAEKPGTTTIVADLTERLGVSRQAVHKQINKLVEEGVLEAQKVGRQKALTFKILTSFVKEMALHEKLEEDRLWDEATQALANIDKDAYDTCFYAFTEMVNNAIEHSNGTQLTIFIVTSLRYVNMVITDNGIGVFKKIADALQLSDMRESLLELSKGKFTTDPERHTGEGIFFTSRILDMFTLTANELSLVHAGPSAGWLIKTSGTDTKGTKILMRLNLPCHRSLKNLFDSFADDDYNFSKTHVPLSLAQIGHEQLVSRSQAKRVLARFEKFEEVMLDFTNVPSIGQAFADEIFRVFRRQHPGIKIIPLGHNAEVGQMINRAIQQE